LNAFGALGLVGKPWVCFGFWAKNALGVVATLVVLSGFIALGVVSTCLQ
jgi:hypothetical protein